MGRGENLSWCLNESPDHHQGETAVNEWEVWMKVKRARGHCRPECMWCNPDIWLERKLTWQWAMNTQSEFIIEGVTCSSQWSLFIVENKEKNFEKKKPFVFSTKITWRKTSYHNLKLSSVIFPIRKKKTWYSNRTKPTECACRQWTTTALACGRNRG